MARKKDIKVKPVDQVSAKDLAESSAFMRGTPYEGSRVSPGQFLKELGADTIISSPDQGYAVENQIYIERECAKYGL